MGNDCCHQRSRSEFYDRRKPPRVQRIQNNDNEKDQLTFTSTNHLPNYNSKPSVKPPVQLNQSSQLKQDLDHQPHQPNQPHQQNIQMITTPKKLSEIIQKKDTNV